MEIWRRYCLRAFCVFGLVAFYCHAAECADVPADSRPNIVLAIADDWSFPHASVLGDRVVKTPTFDRVVREGVVFTRAFCAAPTCSASRAAILTGQAPHRLAEGANLWGTLPARFAVYPDLLEAAGYYVGFERKGWGPGSLRHRKRNPAGNNFRSFDEFYKSVPRGKPFCYWFGSHDPHRPYRVGQGAGAGLKAADVTAPPYLPDSLQTRGDILDYYFAVQRYDRESGHILQVLEAAGKLDNTLFVMTGDNGWPFPRAKANLYDAGTHVPLAVRWPARAKAGRSSDALISLTDLAPTFLEAAGLRPLPEMTARSFLPILVGDNEIAKQDALARPFVYTERERHANVRSGDLSYPSRAIHDDKFLYIRNFRPDLWPAGDPTMWKAVGPFGDIDGGPTKDLLLSRRLDAGFTEFFKLACDKRPEEEMFDLSKDPFCLRNVAGYSEYRQEQLKLRAGLDTWMSNTGDPRAAGGGKYDAFDHYRYYGPPTEQPATRATTQGH